MKLEQGSCIDEMLNKTKELETALLDVKRLMMELGAIGSRNVGKVMFISHEEHLEKHPYGSAKDNYFKANELAEGKIGELFETARAKEVKKREGRFDWDKEKIEPPMNPDVNTDEPIVPTVSSVLENQYKGE